MGRYKSYSKYVTKHKYYVFIEGMKLRVPIWRLIIHDWTKLLPREALPYARTFRNADGSMRKVESLSVEERIAFKEVLRGHMNRHPHHWAWWVRLDEDLQTEALPMSDAYRREMLADWRGASRALTGKDNTAAWYLENKDKMLLHWETRDWIEKQLEI